jgi:hypothetical protein
MTSRSVFRSDVVNTAGPNWFDGYTGDKTESKSGPYWYAHAFDARGFDQWKERDDPVLIHMHGSVRVLRPRVGERTSEKDMLLRLSGNTFEDYRHHMNPENPSQLMECGAMVRLGVGGFPLDKNAQSELISIKQARAKNRSQPTNAATATEATAGTAIAKAPRMTRMPCTTNICQCSFKLRRTAPTSSSSLMLGELMIFSFSREE